MSRVAAPTRLVAMIAAVLVVPCLALVAPANAGTPVPTRVQLTPFNQLDDESVLGLAADVRTATTDSDITGTVTFRDDTGTVLASEVPVSLDVGYAQVYVPKPSRPTTFYVDFHGTGGYGDSTSSAVYTPTRFRTVMVTPEPTILKITAGTPKLTLTLSAYARFKDGTPAPGVIVEFNGNCLYRGPRGMCQGPTTRFCTAVSDGTGLASCRGAGLFGSIVSIVNGSVTMSAYSRSPYYYVRQTSYTPPVIASS